MGFFDTEDLASCRYEGGRMNNMKAILEAVQSMSQYDENAKMILADKEILANILVRAVDDFSGMNPKEVEQLIEGEPSIGKTPIAPGLTNGQGKGGIITVSGMGTRGDACEKSMKVNEEGDCTVITGMNTENKVRNEGVTYFDILFYVRTEDGVSKVIINVEAQKKEPSEYDVEMRGIFYASREISSQLDREFSDQRYNEIKKVYSIWIVMNTREDTIDRIHLHKEDVLGSSRWKPMYDLLNVVIIRMKNKLTSDTTYELHRMLGALFTKELELEERYNVLEEFGIGLKGNREEMVKSMCNLGEGIWERGIERGIEQGIEQEKMDVAMRMIEINKLSFEEIAMYSGLTLEQVLELGQKLQSV